MSNNCYVETDFQDCFAATESALKEFLSNAVPTQEKLQRYQAEVMPEKFGDVSDEELAIEYGHHIAEEVFEYLREFPSRKRWKLKPDPTDKQAAAEEMADIFVVAVISMMYGGLDLELVAETYSYKLRRTLAGVRKAEREKQQQTD